VKPTQVAADDGRSLKTTSAPYALRWGAEGQRRDNYSPRIEMKYQSIFRLINNGTELYSNSVAQRRGGMKNIMSVKNN
jgi:hypothetical protein